jgi:RNA binding exosome subunit
VKKEMADYDAEEVEKILKTVSEMVPNLIRGIVNSIFSAEAGRNMGAAAANFYKELKNGGLPDEVSLKMTQDYVKTFTGIGDLFKEAMSKKGSFSFDHEGKHGEDIGETIKAKIKEKMSEAQEEKE